MGSPGTAERCQVSCGGSLFTLLQPVMSLQLKSCCKENRCRHGFITQFFKAYHGQFGSLGSCLSEQGLILRSVVPGLLDFRLAAVTLLLTLECSDSSYLLLTHRENADSAEYNQEWSRQGRNWIVTQSSSR